MMSSKNKNQNFRTVVGLVVIIIAISAYVVFKYSDKENKTVNFGGDFANLSFLGNSEMMGNGGAISGDLVSDGQSSVLPQNFSLPEIYTDQNYKFSFRHPADYKVSIVKGEEGDILVLQNNKSEGFQILIQKIEENIKNITAEMIKNDLPDLVIKSPQSVILGSSGGGVAFESDNPVFGGRSREVWFVYNKVFYQLSANFSQDTLVQTILSSWEFK